MLLELEKYKEDIFQQAINFWYNLDNESQVNISNGYKLILENWKECHYFWMDGLEYFIGFSCKMQLDMNRTILIF